MFTENDFKIINNRHNLFYDKFKFKIIFKLSGIHYFRYVNTIEQFNKRINLAAFSLRFKNNFDYTIKEICESNLECIKNIILWKEKNNLSDNFVFRVEADTLTVYSNDLKIFDELADIVKNKAKMKKYQVLDLKLDKNKIYLKNPKFKYRIYLNYKKWTREERDQLKTFLLINSENYGSSFVLNKWLTNFSNYFDAWSLTNFTINVKEESMLTYIAIKFPDAIKKVVEIEKR